ncbi:MAG: cellulase family glycosylhydrolase [Planctomycetota bacterium]
MSQTSAQCNSCWLETDGTEIVNATTGQPIQLRAVGLGGWLLQEGYMLNPQGCNGCPGTQWQMKLQYLSEGLPIEQVELAYQLWRDNFVTKADIDYIASLGFNSVRLPMHYELFLTDEQRAVRNDVITDLFDGHDRYKDELRRWYNDDQLFIDADLEGFRVVDRLIDWCDANDIYVILDMHAAPGAQGTDHNISDGFHDNNLWIEPVFQDVLDRLWLAISNRYKNESRVAMYEFFNEPNNVPGGGQAIHALTQRILNTVRNNGDNHIITVHGNGWSNHYDFMEPFTFAPNWNLVYSAHRYWIDPADDAIPNGNPNIINRMVDLTAFRDRHNVPVWVGETGENNNDWLAQNFEKMEDAGLGWCHWTYKRHDVWENAALSRIGGNYPTDGRHAISNVLNSIRFENNIPNPNTTATVTAFLPDAWSTGCSTLTNNCAPIGQTVWLRAYHGEHVSSNASQAALTADRTTLTDDELFTIVDAGDGTVALRTMSGLYVSSEDGQGPMQADRPTVGAWERFEWLDLGNGGVALKGSNGKFVSSENGQSPMRCDRDTIQEWETFKFAVAAPCASDIATPFGQLDFFDTLEFLRRHDASQPGADLAQPLGAFNSRDTVEHLMRANAGCP